MRDIKRIPKVLKEIEKIWKKFPDMRLMQLLQNLVPSSNASMLYFVEDEELIKALKKMYEGK